MQISWFGSSNSFLSCQHVGASSIIDQMDSIFRATWQRRKSSLVPTRMRETPGQCALSSGPHCDVSVVQVMQVQTRTTPGGFVGREGG